MSHVTALSPEFVEFVPEVLEDGKLYVSMTLATVIHRCCCGCGHEVVTPLSPADWTLIFDGESVSLTPSVGNWEFPCQSHYWIQNNKIQWAGRWSREEIEQGRARDTHDKKKYLEAKSKGEESWDFDSPPTSSNVESNVPETKSEISQSSAPPAGKKSQTWLEKFKKRLLGRFS